MTKELDNYSAFNNVNLSNVRSENESYEDYKKRLKQNESILKLYNTVGLDAFKEMFPSGVKEALKNNWKTVELFNIVNLSIIIKISSLYYPSALKKISNYFEDEEEYEKCAEIKNILNSLEE